MKRNVLRVGIMATVLLAVGGHVLWWYLPTERSVLPTSELSGPVSDDDLWVWIAFPHLNLAELRSAVPEGDELLAALARLGGREAPSELPAFGPFSVPPAREMVLAMGEGGQRFRLEAQIDPVVASLARLAGLVAGNVWLSGGEIESPGGLITVTWSGSRWVASRGEEPPSYSGHVFRLSEPALGAMAIKRTEIMPKGDVLVFRRISTGLELATEAVSSSRLVELRTDHEDLALMLLRGSSTGSPGGLVLFAGRKAGGIRLGSKKLSAPGVAVLRLQGEDRWDLPGEKMFRLREIDLGGETSPWQIASYSDALVKQAADLVQPLRPRLAEVERGELDFALTMYPERAEDEVGPLLEALAKSPLSSRRERQKWKDAHRVLRALGGLERVTLVSASSPSIFRLALYPEDAMD